MTVPFEDDAQILTNTAVHNCPNCGQMLERRLRQSKVVTCPSCGTTVYLDDGSFRAPGAKGELHEAPGLLDIGRNSILAGKVITPVGVIRYSYGRGWWDEFWCEDGNEPLWVSVDEGDIVIERPVDDPEWAWAGLRPKLGDTVQLGPRVYTATEAETATCIGFAGELPEAPELGELHHFVNFVSPPRRALSLEVWGTNHAWFSGEWIDPWQVARP